VAHLRHKGYFEPHVHLAKEAQDIKYESQPDRFTAKLYLGVNYHVAEPLPSKRHFLDLVLEQLERVNSGYNDIWLGKQGSQLRFEWLSELENRIRQRYVARGPQAGSPLPESSLVIDPRTVEAVNVDSPSGQGHVVKLPECPGCVDIHPLVAEKDQMLV
jgi:hypothetical protein